LLRSGARAGVALVEFAIAVPVLITLYLGAFVLSDEISCSRKVTVTARTVTDLTTRYASMTSTQLATIMASSAQVLAPYPVNKASVRVSELLVTGSTQVVWSQANAASGTATIPALTVGSTITLPANMATTGTYLVLGGFIHLHARGRAWRAKRHDDL
jgi:Flp pilus assembly protein TadG